MTTDEKIKNFKNEVKIWCRRLKVFPHDVRVEKIKQWGFCTADGVVYFNRDLLLKRKELQMYVIVHELLHLKVPNHSRLFQALMRIHVPHFKELHKELNKKPEMGRGFPLPRE